MPLDTENSVFQSLMSQAYDKWHQHKDWTFRQFINHLDFRERVAVLLGTMNYQIENGGVSQWIDNAYALNIMQIIDILDCDITTETAKRWAGYLRELAKYLNLEATPRGFFGNYWRDEEESEDGEHTDGWIYADRITNIYYDEIGPQLLLDVEEYLSKGT